MPNHLWKKMKPKKPLVEKIMSCPHCQKQILTTSYEKQYTEQDLQLKYLEGRLNGFREAGAIYSNWNKKGG